MDYVLNNEAAKNLKLRIKNLKLGVLPVILNFLFFILNSALALRFYRLEAQSFWYDEGNSARIAERSLRLIIEGDNAIVKQSVLDMIAKYVADNYLQVLDTDI